MSWFTRLWRRDVGALPGPTLAEQAADAVVVALDDRFSRLESVLEPMAESGQRTSRSLAKLGLRLDELERKLEGGFAAQASAARPAPKTFEGLHDLLDAMDSLDAACASLAEDEKARAVREGLRGVLVRLDRAVRAAGAARHADVEVAPDPRLFRVVGTVEQSTGEPGLVVRVTRAAVTSGTAILREGEVLTRLGSAS
jgi:hypothetical protein